MHATELLPFFKEHNIYLVASCSYFSVLFHYNIDIRQVIALIQKIHSLYKNLASGSSALSINPVDGSRNNLFA
jgi:hypothetical protein